LSNKREKLLDSAQKHIRKGSWDKAVRDYQQILEEDAGDVRTRLKVADLLVKIDKFDEALTEYQHVAYHYAKDDIYDKAVAVYKQALRIAPDDPRLHRDLGESYWRHGRLKDSLRAFHMAQKLFRELGDAVSQRDVLERMVSIDAEDVSLQIQLAERYEKDGMRVEALRIFRTCAGNLREEGRLDEFLQVAERAVFLESTDVALRKEIIRLYLDREDNKHALKHLQFLFKETPSDGEVLNYLGLCFDRLGEKQKATLVYLELAKAQRRGGDDTGALATYRKILAIDPNHAEARSVVGQRERQDSSPGVSDTGNLSKPAQSTDVLKGVEFLDDDDDELEIDTSPTNEGAGDDFMDFAEELGDLDSSVLNRFDENPATTLGQQTVARDVSDVELPEIEVIAEVAPTQDGRGTSTITQMLAESDVFLKYRLFDRAEEVIGRAVALEPNSLAVHEQMHQLRSLMGDRMKAGFELFELTRLSAKSPARAVEYLRRAREFADEATVQRYAQRYGIELSAGPMDALSLGAIEEISEGIVELSETFSDADLVVVEPIVEFLPPDDDVDLSGESAVEDSGEILGLDDLGFDDELSLGDMDSELPIGDAEEMMLDVDDIKFDESELELFSEASEGSFSFDFTGDDADKMFEELFGETPAASVPKRVEKSSNLVEVDRLIEQGLLSEAEEVLEEFVDRDPHNPGIMARQAHIQELKNEDFEDNSAFGEKSLSGRFAKEYSMVLKSGPADVDNTNIELGLTYMDMGLFEEAFKEFTQAHDDVSARNDAIYYLAICEFELNEAESATRRLRALLADATVPARIHRVAASRLEQSRQKESE